MDNHESTFREALTELNAAAAQAGVPSTRRSLWLLTTALAIADANIRGGATEEQFSAMARATHRAVRGSLETGVRS